MDLIMLLLLLVWWLLYNRNNAMAKATKTYDLDIERLKSQHKAMEEAASARGEEVEKLKVCISLFGTLLIDASSC